MSRSVCWNSLDNRASLSAASVSPDVYLWSPFFFLFPPFFFKQTAALCLFADSLHGYHTHSHTHLQGFRGWRRMDVTRLWEVEKMHQMWYNPSLFRRFNWISAWYWNVCSDKSIFENLKSEKIYFTRSIPVFINKNWELETFKVQNEVNLCNIYSSLYKYYFNFWIKLEKIQSLGYSHQEKQLVPSDLWPVMKYELWFRYSAVSQ